MKKKKIVRSATVAEIKSQRLASLIQLFILLTLAVYLLLDTIIGLNGSLFISLLLFGSSFLLKVLLEKYILPPIFEKFEAKKNHG